MRFVSFHDWIRRIYATRDDELDCDQVFELLAAYVEAVVEGKPTGHFADVEHHLWQCPHCTGLFRGVRDAARLEKEQAAPVSLTVEHC